jgi:hypothetical protein
MGNNDYSKLVESGQDIFDMTLQEYGNIQAVFLLLNRNDLDIETTLSMGQSLVFEKIPSIKIQDANVMDYYRRYTLRVNCHDIPEIEGAWITEDGTQWITDDASEWSQ